MNIVLDVAGSLTSPEKGGISYFLEEYLATLAELDSVNHYYLFGSFYRNYRERVAQLSIPQRPNIHIATKKFPAKISMIAGNKFHISIPEILLSKSKIDLFHALSGSLPFLRSIPSLFTLYDLSFAVNPEWYRDNWFSGIQQEAERAHHIIAPSHATKKDILHYYGIPEEKISVIYLGCNSSLFYPRSKKEIQEFLHTKSAPSSYFLTVATSAKRKNITGLLHSLTMIKEKINPFTLIVIAGSLRSSEEISLLVEKTNLTKEVLIFHEVKKEELPYFYSGAKAFLFPSLYEGFGLPILEAMACGTPVITSNLSSLPEIAGNAAILVDPYNPEEISASILRLCEDPVLEENLRNAGILRAAEFSWEKTVTETISLYKKIIL